MLKWMVPARGHPAHPASVGVSHQLQQRQEQGTQQPIPRATDDPLATINPEAIVATGAKQSLSLKLIASKRRRKLRQEEIYCVSRTNPLFSEEAMAAGSVARYSVDAPERLSIGDGQWSDPGEPSRSTSSSGYESANNGDYKQPYRQNNKSPGEVIRNPASDYRRCLALGKWSVDVSTVAPKTGRVDVQTAVKQKNPAYVTKIQMPVDSLQSADQAECGRKSDAAVPAPVWPSKAHQTSHFAAHCAHDAERKPDRLEPLDSAALVESNKNYVTKIMIAQRSATSSAAEHGPAAAAAAAAAVDETLDSIVTDSLLKWTSYSGQHDDAVKWRDPEPSGDDPANRPEAELAAVRQLSQCLGKRKAVATVSRALSKSGSVSAASETYATHVSGRESSPGASVWPASDEEVEITYQRLDQRYVPKNGDANYATASRRTDSALRGAAPFSYLAGVYSPSHQINSVRGNGERRRSTDDDRNPIPIGDHRRESLEHDRQSNSSSRSSGSRRVTFSADTVDNEPSNQSSASTAPLSHEPSTASPSASSSSSAGSSPTLPRPELALDPHHLAHRYHLTSAGSTGTNQHVPIEHRGRLAGYYTYNLKSHPSFFYKHQSGPVDEEAGEWENYRADYSKTLPAPSPSTRTSTVVKMLEPYGAVQLHPNYAFACQERGPCVDFTLDGGDISLLHRRDVHHKLRRRLCCCLLLLLCFIVLIIVVMGVSLYLSQGEKIFGSA